MGTESLDESEKRAEIVLMGHVFVDYFVEDEILFALVISVVYILNLFLEDKVLQSYFGLVFVE